MQSGLALAHNRVEQLKVLAIFLKTQMYEQGKGGVYHNVWLPDVKQVGGERVDIERFNAPIISEFRATLDDIAKETGGRKAQLKVDANVNYENVTTLTPEQRLQAMADLTARVRQVDGSHADESTSVVAESGPPA